MENNTKNKIENKTKFEEALKSMLNGSAKERYCFYASMILACDIEYSENIPTLGVRFDEKLLKYNLAINLEFFNKLTDVQRLGVLKHEMLHILNGHTTIRMPDNCIPEAWNAATDCAINQMISKSDLPKPNINIDSFRTHIDKNALENMNAEYYYDLILIKLDNSNSSGSSSDSDSSNNQDNQDNQDNSGNQGNQNEQQGSNNSQMSGLSKKSFDSHKDWKQSKEFQNVVKEITSKMIDKAIQQTMKSNGTLPNDIDEYINLFSNKSILNWRQLLRKYTGNKRVGRISTIMRKSKRFPTRDDLRGYQKDRTFDCLVVLDVSGSMSDKEIMDGLNEIHHICKLTNSKLKLVQVDTEVHSVEEFTKKTKLFNRKGNGGTILQDGIDVNVKRDLTILITDGCCEDVKMPKQSMILITNGGDEDYMKDSGIKTFMLKDNK